LTDFNEKNTTLRAGVAGTDDRVAVNFEPAYLPKHTKEAIIGVTQLLGPTTFATLNLSSGLSTGLSLRAVQDRGEIGGDPPECLSR